MQVVAELVAPGCDDPIAVDDRAERGPVAAPRMIAAEDPVALDASEAARDFFATLNKANRYAILWRIQTTKRAETRAKRIAAFIEILKRGEKLYP